MIGVLKRSVESLVWILLAIIFSASVEAAEPRSGDAVNGESATVKVFNRDVVTFRSAFLGLTAAQRAEKCQSLLNGYLHDGQDYTVGIKDNPEGKMVMLGTHLAFIVTPNDVDTLAGETIEAATEKAAKKLQRVIIETREARSLSQLLRSLAYVGIATLIYVLLLIGVRRLRRWEAGRFALLAGRKAGTLTIAGQSVLETHSVFSRLQQLIDFVCWLLIALLTYEWVSFVLLRFPYTRPWGEQLNVYLYSILTTIGTAMIDALPGMALAATIFLMARLSANFSGRLLTRLSYAKTERAWLNSETLPTTRRLVACAIWLFALAMAYPYLPGAQTDAFKGLSVLLGLMVSLGASSIVGQGAAGLILTYTRTIRPGEYVRIGEHEGTVVQMGMFTTRIRTGLGEELTLPNSMITASVTKNYSRAVQGPGYIIDTTVTIGYDTPWRQVEAMLTEAARRTAGILMDPSPVVFQTGLSDYYPEYRLVAQAVPERPRPRAEVLSQLHANIQDVFNEYGVQIMSPHYMADPVDAKVVPPDNWFAAPAQREETPQQPRA